MTEAVQAGKTGLRLRRCISTIFFEQPNSLLTFRSRPTAFSPAIRGSSFSFFSLSSLVLGVVVPRQPADRTVYRRSRIAMASVAGQSPITVYAPHVPAGASESGRCPVFSTSVVSPAKRFSRTEGEGVARTSRPRCRTQGRRLLYWAQAMAAAGYLQDPSAQGSGGGEDTAKGVSRDGDTRRMADCAANSAQVA